MLEHICERNVWDTIRESPLPVVLYGMGDGADRILDRLARIGVTPAAVFASDEFVRGHSFRGYRVEKYSDICARYPDFLIILAFAVRDRPTLDRIRQISREHPLLAPDIPVAGDGLFTREFIHEHDDAFDRAFALPADNTSREAYLDVLRYKVSGKTEYLFRCETPKEEVYQTILHLTQEERIVDLGAYDGDTVREFLSACGGPCRSICAWEPNPRNFKKLLRHTEGIPGVECLELGAWDQAERLPCPGRAGRNSQLGRGEQFVEADSVDNRITGPVTLLKMDIEGSESRALEGAKRTIRTWLPKLYVCAYHRNEDMFQLPLQIHACAPQYRFFFRHHPYVPAWESNFYAGSPQI